jgi:transcriptional regulator with XRE-family HTH domain
MPGGPVNGKRLRQLRKRAGLTQVQLSLKAGAGVMACSRIERGAVQPRLSTLQAFAKVLGVTVDELLGEPDPEPAEQAS